MIMNNPDGGGLACLEFPISRPKLRPARRRASSIQTSMRLSVTMSPLFRQRSCAERKDPTRI
jgi:hypothetical protein